jgi:hypothetical protein
MNGVKYGEGLQIVNLHMGTSTGTQVTKYVKVDNAHHVTFLVGMGTVDTATTITVRETSAATTVSAEAIAFWYRLSGAASADNTDTWGALTSATTTGVAYTATTDTGKFLLIDIDPDDLTEGDHYLSLLFSATNYSAAPEISVVAFLEPRYGGATHPSST